MQKIAVIQITKAGKRIAQTLQQELNASIIARNAVPKRWEEFEAFIFIGAMGICVRTIAPFIKDKHKDPAVICVDSTGQHVISVLSGHVGGANELTRKIVSALGSSPVITTQSDNTGLWALDTLADRFNWALMNEADEINASIFAFVNHKPTALFMEVRDRGTDYLEQTLPEHVTLVHDLNEVDSSSYKLLIMVTPFDHVWPDNMEVLHFVPVVATIGFGLAHHPDDYMSIYDQMEQAVYDAGVMPWACRYCQGQSYPQS